MARETNFELSLADINALFKIKYEKLSENVYNSANVLLGRVKKSYKFTGRKLQITIPQSFAGGVGSGSLPKANAAKYAAAEIEAKKVYAVVDIDRETIKASMSSEGAFVQATKEVVKKGVESFMRNMSRILFNDGSGLVGKSATILAGTTDPDEQATLAKLQASGSHIQVAMDPDSFKEANLEEKDLVDVTPDSSAVSNTAVAQVEIISVDPDNKTIVLNGISAGGLPAVSLDKFRNSAGDLVEASIHMQGSEGNDPDGLKGVIQKSNRTANKSYGIEHGRRWEAVDIDQKALNSGVSQDLTTDMLNEVMLKVKKKCGKSPNLIIASYTQYEKLLNAMESKKQFNVNTRAGLKSKSGADISFSGIEFMSIDGAVGIFPERFVEDDTIYFLNDDHIHIYHRPDFGWFDDDGTVFLRKAGYDEYEARYGGYLEVYINPAFHGCLRGLTIA